MHADGVIVNQIQPEEADCEFCQARRNIQEKRLETIKQKFGDQLIAQVPLFQEEVKGMDRLRGVARILYGEEKPLALE